MKKIIIAIAAMTMTATPVLAAPAQSHGQQAHSQSDRGNSDQAQSAKRGSSGSQASHQWKRGDRFDRSRATNYRVISNPRTYKLQTAPNGYRWVQSGRDAVLVRLSNNVISSVVTGVIR